MIGKGFHQERKVGLCRLGRGLQARVRFRLCMLCRDEEQHQHHRAQHSEDASEDPTGSDTRHVRRSTELLAYTTISPRDRPGSSVITSLTEWRPV